MWRGSWPAIVGAVIALGSGSHALGAAPRVATFSVGTPGTPTFEALSFWVMADRSTRVIYAYGAKRREEVLRQLPSSAGTLRARFRNGATVRIRRSGQVLRVTGVNFRYVKAYRWQYEGPVNGVGTACTVCVAPSKAMAFVESRFLGGRR